MKRSWLVCLAFVVIGVLQALNLGTLLVGVVHASSLSFSTTKNLSSDPEISDFPKIASSGPNAYATWLNSTDATNPDVLFAKSGDNGTSFGPVVNLSNNPDSSTDQEISASGSNVYVAWVDNSTGNSEILFRKSNDNGTTFSTAVNLSNDGGESTSHRLAAVGTKLYVAWQNEVSGPPGSTDVFFAVSVDNGGSFGVVQNLSNDGKALSPEIAAAGNDVYVSWQDLNGGRNDILLRASNNSGSSFGVVVNLSNNPSSPVTSSITQRMAAITSAVYVVWANDTLASDDIVFRASLDDGANFGNTVLITNNGASTSPQIAAQGTYVHLAWEDHSIPGGFSVISYTRSSNQGAAFEPAVQLSTSTGFSTRPILAAEGTNLYASWEDSTGDTDVFLVSSDDSGASFSPPFNLSNNIGFSFSPVLATGVNRAFVAWQDDTSGNDEIFLRTGVVRIPFQPHGPIFINGNAEFTAANGVVAGTGTALDPYIIDGWLIDTSSTDAITIENTDADFVVQNVKVQSSAHNVTGIIFDNVSNGRLENSTILGDFSGFRIARSTSVTINNNTFTDNRFTINLYSSSNINFTENKIANTLEGISIYYSTNVLLQRNRFSSSGVLIQGSTLAEFDSHTITLDNLVNGNPIYYYKNCGPQTIRDMTIGELIVANCSQFEASNLVVVDSTVGVEMAFVNNTLITGNSISSNNLYGMYLVSLTSVSIAGNDVSSNLGFGMRLEFGQNVTIASNNISSNGQYGLSLFGSQGVRVYHNNVTSNAIQAFDSGGSGNVWDNGYPVGGNHWSDYPGLDNCSGSAQDICTGPDGIGDTPYTIAVSAVDRYPLTQPAVPDTSPPTWPGGSSLTSIVGHLSVALTWSDATDNVGVVQYRVYKGNTVIASLAANIHNYNVTGLTVASSYTFKVEAGDASSNWSTDGPSIGATTKTGPTLDPISSKTVDEETILSFNLAATDPDGDLLSFSLGSAPPMATITSNGAFDWTPTEAQGPGTYSVTVNVSDGWTINSQVFSVTVREVNAPPVLASISDKTVNKGDTLTFRVNATDPDLPVETLTFSLANPSIGKFPDGASITQAGVFSWTPSADQAGNYTVKVIVSDGEKTSSTEFTIDVVGTQGPVGPFWVAWVALGVVGVSAVSVAIWVASRRRRRPMKVASAGSS